jgi:hypothetical protein
MELERLLFLQDLVTDLYPGPYKSSPKSHVLFADAPVLLCFHKVCTSARSSIQLRQQIRSDQKVSVHLMITIQKVTIMLKLSPASLQTAWQPTARAKGDTRLTLTPSVIPNSNYVIMVSGWSCLKYLACFLYCNHQLHRDIFIILYMVYVSTTSVRTTSRWVR